MAIKSIEDLLARSVKNEETGCMNLKSSSSSNGYPRVSYKGKVIRANRLAYQLSRGVDPNESFVCHKCDNTLCVNPEHLFLGSHEENMADMVKKGRSKKGDAHGRSKLNDELVLEIRRSGLSNRSAAKIYGVAPCTIGQIMRREIWTHL